jgi:hypothetical protein
MVPPVPRPPQRNLHSRPYHSTAQRRLWPHGSPGWQGFRIAGAENKGRDRLVQSVPPSKWPPSTLCPFGKDNVGTKDLQHLAPLNTHRLRHGKVSRYPLAAATKASAIPVFPDVGSMISMPGFSLPAFSASQSWRHRSCTSPNRPGCVPRSLPYDCL